MTFNSQENKTAGCGPTHGGTEDEVPWGRGSIRQGLRKVRGGSPEDCECGVTTASLVPDVKQRGEGGRRCREGWALGAIPGSPTGVAPDPAESRGAPPPPQPTWGSRGEN